MILIVLLFIQTLALPYIGDLRDCMDPTNTTVPTDNCPAGANCYCGFCRPANDTSSNWYCINQTPTLNMSEWNCLKPYDPQKVEKCEANLESLRLAFIILCVGVSVCVAVIIVCAVVSLMLGCQSRKRRGEYDSFQ